MDSHSGGLEGRERLRADVPGHETLDSEFGNSFAGLNAGALGGVQVRGIINSRELACLRIHYDKVPGPAKTRVHW